MKKRRIIFYFSILLMFCQVFGVFEATLAISDNQKIAIIDHCEAIRDDLKNVQKTDTKTRVFLGGYYELILTKFITPLNVKLVEANLSSPELVNNQNDFAETKAIFSNDFIRYQQKLEELLLIDCKTEPEKFYDELVIVRQRRKAVEQDVLKIRELISRHIKLVNEIRGKL